MDPSTRSSVRPTLGSFSYSSPSDASTSPIPSASPMPSRTTPPLDTSADPLAHAIDLLDDMERKLATVQQAIIEPTVSNTLRQTLKKGYAATAGLMGSIGGTLTKAPKAIESVANFSSVVQDGITMSVMGSAYVTGAGVFSVVNAVSKAATIWSAEEIKKGNKAVIVSTVTELGDRLAQLQPFLRLNAMFQYQMISRTGQLHDQLRKFVHQENVLTANSGESQREEAMISALTDREQDRYQATLNDVAAVQGGIQKQRGQLEVHATNAEAFKENIEALRRMQSDAMEEIDAQSQRLNKRVDELEGCSRSDFSQLVESLGTIGNLCGDLKSTLEGLKKISDEITTLRGEFEEELASAESCVKRIQDSWKLLNGHQQVIQGLLAKALRQTRANADQLTGEVGALHRSRIRLQSELDAVHGARSKMTSRIQELEEQHSRMSLSLEIGQEVQVGVTRSLISQLSERQQQIDELSATLQQNSHLYELTSGEREKRIAELSAKVERERQKNQTSNEVLVKQLEESRQDAEYTHLESGIVPGGRDAIEGDSIKLTFGETRSIWKTALNQIPGLNLASRTVGDVLINLPSGRFLVVEFDLQAPGRISPEDNNEIIDVLSKEAGHSPEASEVVSRTWRELAMALQMPLPWTKRSLGDSPRQVQAEEQQMMASDG